jgi:hypothetical protein
VLTERWQFAGGLVSLDYAFGVAVAY